MNTRSETWIYEKDMAWEAAGAGVVRQIMGYDEQAMLVKVKFEKGATGSLHTHPHTQTTYVARGKFEFTIDEETKTVKFYDDNIETKMKKLLIDVDIHKIKHNNYSLN